jgi:hypothetical protein
LIRTPGISIEDCEHAEAWREEHRHANGTVSWHELMGRSVHAKHVIRRLHAAGKKTPG